MMKPRWMVLCAALLGTSGLAAVADDSPQWRGPTRNGIHPEKGLLREWPKGGPKLLWTCTKLGGSGYGSPSIVGGRVYVIGSKGGDEYLFALNEKDGSEIWTVKVGKIGENIGPQYPAPRSTPTVVGEKIYTFSSDGDIACVDAAKGKVLWQRAVKSEFGGKAGAWAYAESPLVDGDAVVVAPGGSKATMIALHKDTGKEIWRAAVPGGGEAAYSSTVVGEAGGVRQYVQFLKSGVIAVDAKTGKFLWRYDKTANKSANNPTPIFHKDYVFSASGGPGGGAGALTQITADGGKVNANQVYLAKALQSNIGGHVIVGDHVYGGGGTTGVICAELMTGKEKWRTTSVGAASICYADGHLYLRGHNGQTALVEATPDGYKERGRFSQPKRGAGKGLAWAYPVVANGRLYLRDNDLLFCYDVKAQK